MGLRGTLFEIRAQTPLGNHRSAKNGDESFELRASQPCRAGLRRRSWAAYIPSMTAEPNDKTNQPTAQPEEKPKAPAAPAPRPREIGGPKGPEPTRYGDWEVGGRCIDF
jgi:hypothetical protein